MYLRVHRAVLGMLWYSMLLLLLWLLVHVLSLHTGLHHMLYRCAMR